MHLLLRKKKRKILSTYTHFEYIHQTNLLSTIILIICYRLYSYYMLNALHTSFALLICIAMWLVITIF